MKALFVHEHRFVLSDNKYYTTGSMNNIVLSRYVEAYGQLHIASRIVTDRAAFENNVISNPNITFSNLLDGRLKIIKRCVKDCDVLIARIPDRSAFLAIHYAKLFKKKYIVEVVADPRTSLKYYGGIIGKLASPIFHILQKHYTFGAPNVLYVSRFFLQNIYPTKGRTCSCGDTSFPKPNQAILDARLRRIEELDKRRMVVGLIGSLDIEYRGHRTLLKAAELLKNRGIYIEIHFLGTGDSKKWIEQAETLGIKDQVYFDGVLPSGDPVLSWIDKIDILAMPTQQETLGRAIIEAMSRACPVLGSVETAIWEQIGSECLFHATNQLELSELIANMYYDREFLKLCAIENYWRSYKYDEKKADLKRLSFLKSVIE